MIHFRKVRWKNFLSTGNVFTEVKLDEQPTTLIIGENGAGKSTILDALCFGLYGKPFRKIKKDQLINSINSREAIVEVEFSVYGREYKIRRGIKPALFEIFENDKMLDQAAAARDYQEHLERNILRLNMKSFTQIVILGSSSFVPFMQLTTSVRREVIEDLLDIRIFSTMSVLLKERISKNKESTSLNNKDIDNIEELVTVHEETVKQSNLHKESVIEKHSARIEELNKEIESFSDTNESLQNEIEEIQSQIGDEKKNDEYINKTVGIKNDLKAKRNKSEKTAVFYEETGICPTCNQDITEESKQKHIEESTAIIRQIDIALLDLDSKIEKARERRDEIKKIQEDISKSQKKIAVNQSEIKSAQREIRVLNNEIEKIRNQQENDSAEKLKEFQKRLSAAIEEKKTLLDAREVLDVASVILRDSGIKSRIIKQYIPIINTLVNKYLAAMDFFVKFELDETFVEKILSRHRDDFTYDSFSEGEKMRIDLALLFTWRSIARMKNSANTNLLILDEVFDASLDTNGCDEFLKIIHSLDDANVFVISHKGDILQDKFRSCVRFEKHKNFSRIAA